MLHSLGLYVLLIRTLLLEQNITHTITLQGLDAERDVLRESQRLASERDRELESLRQQVRFTSQQFWQIKSTVLEAKDRSKLHSFIIYLIIVGQGMHFLKTFKSSDQRAKKVVSDSPGPVDFAIGLVNSVINFFLMGK